MSPAAEPIGLLYVDDEPGFADVVADDGPGIPAGLLHRRR